MHPDPPTFREWLGDIDSFPRGFMVIARFNEDHSVLFGIELQPIEARQQNDAA